MKLKYKHTILVVDDEISITKSLHRLFRKEGFNVIEANSGKEGLEKLKSLDKPASGIISDQRMPNMTGSQFLQKAKTIAPDAFRILLTGYSEIDAIIEAINMGRIHRYITKPWKDEELLFQVCESLKQYELVLENKRLNNIVKKQNRELKEINTSLEQRVEERSRQIRIKNRELEQNLFNTVRAFASLIDISTPIMTGHGRRVSLLAKQLANNLNLSETEVINVEIAALLHDIGKVGIPQKLFTVETPKMTDEEKNLYARHPEEGQGIVRFINRLDHVGLIIRSHHERFDGRGFPDQLKEDFIPIESQIIAVADRYDKIVNLGIEKNRYIREYTKDRGTTYDHIPEDKLMKSAAVFYIKKNSFTEFSPDVVKAFLDLTEKQGINDEDDIEIELNDVSEGMVLSRSLYTKNGRFILPYNTCLTAEQIHKLKILQSHNPIIGSLFIKK